jgi:acyl carrier protein
MVDQGARHLVLVGRSLPSREAQEQISQWQATGAEIVFAQGDICQASDLQKILANIAQFQPPLRGILHLAGVLDDKVLLGQNWDSFAKVMKPKVQGAWNLHRQTQNLPLDFFVMFSSIASVIGSPGQGNYSAGNAFLDALAHYRQQQNLPALSINWCPWAEAGMAADLGHSHEQRWTATGISVLTPEQGLNILEQLFNQSCSQISVIQADWSKFLQHFPADHQPVLLSQLATHLSARSLANSSTTPVQYQLLEQLKAVTPKQRPTILTSYLQKAVGTVMGQDSLPETQVGFFDMGMDSLMTLELKNNLQTSLGITLTATVTYEYSTIETLAEYLLTQVIPIEQPSALDSLETVSNPEEIKILAEIEKLSVNELEALINEELAVLSQG